MYKHHTNVNAIFELRNGMIVNYVGNWQSNSKTLNFEWRTDCTKGIILQKEQIDLEDVIDNKELKYYGPKGGHLSMSATKKIFFTICVLLLKTLRMI